VPVKKAGSGINMRFIDNYKKDYTAHSKDKTFLVYDYDVPEIVEKLQKISEVELLFSNPCFELWYLLHYQKQTSASSSNECITKLEKFVERYKNGELSAKLKTKLSENQNNAIERAKLLPQFNNPSTNIYLLIEELGKNQKSTAQ
jgi:hypothetical protein